MYSRSEISKKTGIGFETVRYYEKFGLLIKPLRGENRYRQYDETTVERIFFILQAKKCGFTLSEIRTMLSLFDHPEDCSTNSDDIIDSKINQLDRKIEALTRMKKLLNMVKEPIRKKDCHQISLINIENL